MSTRAIALLKQYGITHEVIKYRHLKKGAEFAARATGYPIESTVKTLVVALDQKRHYLTLVPGHLQLDLKKLAAALGGRRCAMVDIRTAERLTGYHVGGISPFATRRPIPAVMEAGILSKTRVLINAGQRGIMLKMVPGDILKLLNCRTASIA